MPKKCHCAPSPSLAEHVLLQSTNEVAKHSRKANPQAGWLLFVRDTHTHTHTLETDLMIIIMHTERDTQHTAISLADDKNSNDIIRHLGRGEWTRPD